MVNLLAKKEKERAAYLIVLIAPGVVLPHSQDEVQDRDKRPDSVRITPQHDVAEADVIVCGDMARSHARER